MTTHGGAFVRIGSQVLALVVAKYVAVHEDDIPSHAFAPIRCDRCGAVTIMAAPVEYELYDDDHFGRFELWYISNHAGACSGCQAPLSITLGYTRQGRSVHELRELGLDGTRMANGGQLASIEGLEIPEEARVT